MLKHNEIIQKLNAKQKLALVSSLEKLSDPALRELGIPLVEVCVLDELLAAHAPGLSAVALSRAWNPRLIEALTQGLLEKVPSKGARLVITPSPKIKIGKESAALTEDGYLSSVLSQAFLRGAKKASAFACVNGFSLSEDDVSQLDEQPDRRMLMEYFVAPFRQTLIRAGGEAVLADLHGVGKGYGEVNRTLLREARADVFQKDLSLLCRARTPEETVEALQMGCILLDGVSATLDEAHEQYLHMKEAMESGHFSAEALEEALETGSALSDEQLDEAVERVLSFAEQCASVKRSDAAAPDFEKTLIAAYRESTVLMKNENGRLPLQDGKKIALIGANALEKGADGSPSFAELLTKELSGARVACTAGYGNENGENAAELIQQAKNLVQKADVAFIFLSLAPKGAAAILPADQIALLDALSEYRQKIVGVLTCDGVPNMQFDQYLSALMLFSPGGRESARAFADVITGKTSPGGRLTCSYFEDPDEEYARRKFYKSRGRNKVGPFMGYRYYDSMEQTLRYPFGYGKSYSSFVYSGFSFQKDEITFLVENKGKSAADEVAQIYFGKSDSGLIRPRKELKSFFRIELGPGEKKKIRVTDLGLDVFDKNKNRFFVESGEYQVYVGTSLDDIRLTAKIRVSNAETTRPVADLSGRKREELSAYLQSKSNILSDEYTLEAGFSKMKTYNKWRIAGFSTVAGAVLLAILIVWNSLIPVLLAIPLAVLITGAALLVVSFFKRKRYLEELRLEQEASAKKLFADADVVDAASIEELFAEEFDAVLREREEEGTMSTSSDVFHRVNQDLTLPLVAQQLGTFAKESGVLLTAEATGRILSALATSRLILTDTLHGKQLESLVRTVNAYFSASFFSVEVTERHLQGGKLFAVKEQNGGWSATALAEAVAYAEEHRDTLCTVLLKNVQAEDAAKLLTPFLRYFSNPVKESTVYVQENNTSYLLPENLWFFVELAQESRRSAVPSYVAEASVLLRVDLELGEAKREKTPRQSVSYYDFDHVIGSCKRQFTIQEDWWKKVDVLEAYVNSHAPYRIGNKLWLRMETYTAVYCSCGHEKLEALDRALAFGLLPALTSVLGGKLTSDDKTVLEVMEQSFGEDNVAVCRSVLNEAVSKA